MDEKEIKDLVVFDLATMIQGWDLNKTMTIMKEHNILLYDSFNGGHKPFIMNQVDSTLKIIDHSTLSHQEIKSLTEKQDDADL